MGISGQQRSKSGRIQSNDGPSGRRIVVWIYGLAVLLISLSTASLTFIAHMAWREGDRRALENEHYRFSRALSELQRGIAENQINAAKRDATYQAFHGVLDKDFIDTEFSDFLWKDYGFNYNLVIAPGGHIIARVTGGHVNLDRVELSSDDVLYRLANATRNAWAKTQSNSYHNHLDGHLSQSELVDLSRSEFASLYGVPALVSAVPILPDQAGAQITVSDLPVLVSAVYLNEKWMAGISERLAFEDFRFVPNAPKRAHPTNFVLYGGEGQAIGYFRWENAKPGHQIWRTALPLVIFLAAIIAVVAFAAANKISKLSRSLEESEQRNRYFAHHDALTGLANRHHFSDSFQFALDGLPERSFAVLACDLDNFKPINDTLGHEAGDKVLCEIADRLRSMVDPKGLVSRIGGDEFIVLITERVTKDSLRTLAERICRNVAIPFALQPDKTVSVGISIGIAIAPVCGTDETQLVRAADTALYEAKRDGRNTFVFAPPFDNGLLPAQTDRALG